MSIESIFFHTLAASEDGFALDLAGAAEEEADSVGLEMVGPLGTTLAAAAGAAELAAVAP